ncbi:MAG TPA: DUF4386 domain-containing protein, partial [Draconibacterium sp.]|nr:DUF4386 domain-containing protein [Draconibacterium sp.]
MKTNRKPALAAGIALLIMAVVAALTYGYIHNSLVVPGDAETTVENIRSNGLLFHIEVIGWFFILLLDVIVAWALYLFFKNENQNLSFIMAGLRVVFTIIFAVAIFSLIPVLRIANGNIAVVQEIIGKQIMNDLESFEKVWSFSLIIFGFHLFALGILVFRSKYIHNFWGIVLVFVAVSYVLIHSAKFLSPESENLINITEMVLMLPMTFGEVGFAFWLIIWGVKPKTIYKTPMN